jgi:hypothetical protein
MASPVLQKTYQGGSTAGGTQFINVPATSGIPKNTMFLIKDALINFFAVPMTVIGSSDSINSSMDGTDRWITDANLIYAATAGTPYSWIVLQQAGINAKTQILVGLDTLSAADFNREDITIIVSPAAGFGTANGGTDGSTTSLPTATDQVSMDGTNWHGAEGGTNLAKTLTCISSDDGEVTRIVLSHDVSELPITCIGFEKPRLPNSNWVNPAVFYILKETVASGLGVFRWEKMQDQEHFRGVIKDKASADLSAVMRMSGPMVSSTEVVDWIQDGPIPNPVVFAGHLMFDNYVADDDWGTLFDWYWVNRNVGGVHMLDLDTAPLAGNRTLVCVGDCIWGWLDDSESNLLYDFHPFRTFAVDSVELQVHLGIRGQVGTDIAEDSSHFYDFDVLLPVDAGTLAAPVFNFITSLDVTTTTDPDFAQGARTVAELGVTNTAFQALNGLAGQAIPSVRDGTIPWMMGGVARVDTLPGAQIFGTLISQVDNTGSGWIVQIRNDGTSKIPYLRFVIIQNGFGLNTNCDSVISASTEIQLTEPFAWWCGLDVAAGTMFMMTNKVGSFNTTVWVDIGTFADTAPLRTGKGLISGADDSFNGQIAHFWTYQWSAAINAGITQANMNRYVEYLSGNKGP